MMRNNFSLPLCHFLFLFLLVSACSAKSPGKRFEGKEQWWSQAKLSSEQIQICRNQGTERSFSGHLLQEKRQGVYQCAVCGYPLFRSEDKFDSQTGWPSFIRPYSPLHVSEEDDSSFGIKRVEVICSRCHAHLGHVFTDGPAPTGLRYCINSACLQFSPEKSEEKK